MNNSVQTSESTCFSFVCVCFKIHDRSLPDKMWGCLSNSNHFWAWGFFYKVMEKYHVNISSERSPFLLNFFDHLIPLALFTPEFLVRTRVFLTSEFSLFDWCADGSQHWLRAMNHTWDRLKRPSEAWFI